MNVLFPERHEKSPTPKKKKQKDESEGAENTELKLHHLFHKTKALKMVLIDTGPQSLTQPSGQ